MRITSKGQVTIPANIREKTGLLPHTDVEFIHDDNGVRIVPAPLPSGQSRGQRLADHLRGKSDVAMSTDEIMALTRKS
ncbi:MAG: AbrB/MazE/SpoVT family DNA-binding domain-containing protein [Magnetococcales bacterium]|nr:AbrB/MazE/SpoVT family DNA-binding domain-containing protein [Magnetococcales bacterium]